MNNEQTVIETLNRFHVLTITKEEVEVKFEQLLPHYDGKRSEKLYNNLLSAVYNTMVMGYMPEKEISQYPYIGMSKEEYSYFVKKATELVVDAIERYKEKSS